MRDMRAKANVRMRMRLIDARWRCAMCTEHLHLESVLECVGRKNTALDTRAVRRIA